MPKALTPLQQAYRRKSIYRALVADFGGEENISTLQTGLLAQAAILLLRVELAEISIARGEAIDEARFAADTALAIRVLRCLGAKSANLKPEEKEETLADYIARRDAEKARQSQKPIELVSEAPASELAPVAAPLPQQQEPLQ